MNRIFVRQFLRHPRAVSTPFEIWPSLADKMASNIEGKLVVEWGSGLGAITLPILRQLPEEGELYCFDTDREFCEELRDKTRDDPRITVYNSDAQEMYFFLGMGKVPDTIVCSVPFQMIKRKERGALLRLAAQSPLFMPMQYYLPIFDGKPPRMMRVHKRYFKEVQWNPIPVKDHFPPAGYYLCRNNHD